MRLQGVEVQRYIGQRRREEAARGTARQKGIELIAFGQAAAVFVHQLAQRDASRCQLHARLAHPAADAEAAQAFAPVPALRGKPLGATFHQLTYPVQGLDVVLQRGPTEQAHLGHVGRAQPRQAALALDGLDHRGLLAADVGPGAAAQFDGRHRPGRRASAGVRPWRRPPRRPRREARQVERSGQFLAQAPQFPLQQRADAVVLVAQVDPDGIDAHGPGGDEHAFQKAVRVALQDPAVLEGAGLALVDVHRHVARAGVAAHDAPLASGRKPGAAQAAQAGMLQRGDQFVRRTLAAQALRQQGVAATFAIGIEIQRGGNVVGTGPGRGLG